MISTMITIAFTFSVLSTYIFLIERIKREDDKLMKENSG